MIIDISHHQDPAKINYDKLAKQLDFAIIRTQYGSRTIDRHYKTHHAELRKRGVPTAAYAWVRGISLKDMEVEAIDFYNRTKDLNPTFWFLDVEEKSMGDMRAGISAYVKKLRELGAKKIGIYIAHHLYRQFNLNLNEVDAVWIPHYGRNDGTINSKPTFICDLHQYTSVGKLNGYNGNLDLNRIMNGRTIEFFTGKTEKPKPVTTPKAPAKENITTYKIKNGDTLSGIAAKFKTTVKELVKTNNIKNPNLIYVGETIRVSGETAKKENIYTVKNGDTLSKIAINHKTTVEKLVKDNNIKNKNLIYPGQKLKI